MTGGNWSPICQRDICLWISFSTICPGTLTNETIRQRPAKKPAGQQEDRAEGKQPVLTGTFESIKKSSHQLLPLEQSSRISTFCIFEHYKPGQYALALVSCCPSSTYPIYLFPHVIAQSVDQTCNPVLLSSILFPLISFALPVYIAVSPHKQ